MRDYGKVNKIADDYYEVIYTEYREDGSIREVGTEDFSGKRKRNIIYWSVHKDSGKKNKGGHTVWDEIGHVRTTNPKDAKKIAVIKYGEGVQLRRY